MKSFPVIICDFIDSPAARKLFKMYADMLESLLKDDALASQAKMICGNKIFWVYYYGFYETESPAFAIDVRELDDGDLPILLILDGSDTSKPTVLREGELINQQLFPVMREWLHRVSGRGQKY